MPFEVSKEMFGLAGLLLVAAIGYFGVRSTAKTNLQIAREKLETENRLQIAATATVKALLLEPGWELRSFDTIRKRILGFKADEVRKLIVACGAVAFEELESGKELWGLPERNAARLKPPGVPVALKVRLAAPAKADAPPIMPPPALTPKFP